MLGSIGRRKTADWTVLTIERDAAAREPADVSFDVAGASSELDAFHEVAGTDAADGAPGRAAARAVRPVRPVDEEPHAADTVAQRLPSRREASDVSRPESLARTTGSRAASTSESPMRVVETEPAESPAVPSTRRTIVIRGHAAERATSVATAADQRRRPARRPGDRVANRPDRVAMWAFSLALLMILVAVLSALGA